MCKEYYGWPNYETWATFTWIGNNEVLFHRYKEAARDITDRMEIAKGLRDELMRNAEEIQANGCLGKTPTGYFKGIITDSLKRVDWVKIAEALKEE